jgi:PiT family inorganic phosphate transporter
MIALALFLAASFLAYANGANDNFKGVASLHGCKAASYRTAIGWATITTFAGSITAIFLAQALLKKFSGKGLVPDTIVGSAPFLLALAIGAALTVVVATQADTRVMRNIALSWIITLPCAAFLSAVAYALLRHL